MKHTTRPVYSGIRGAARALWLFIFLAAAGCGDSAPQIVPMPPEAVILAFGDSLTSGYGAEATESYPAVLERLTGYQVINAGISGEVSAQGLKRLPALLESHQPDLVILCHGANDLLRRLDRENTVANLRQMITTARASGAQVLLVAVPQPGLLLHPADFYTHLAKELDIPCETDIILDILTTKAEKSDAIHPNAAGYRRLAETLARRIVEE